MKNARIVLVALVVFMVFVSVSCKETPSHVHEFGDWTVIKMATGMEEGYAYRKCKCGATEIRNGYYFYDCDADNDPDVNGGRGEDNLMSTECGWRYLEAAPADLRVVGGVPTVDSSVPGYEGAKDGYTFGYYRMFADGRIWTVGTGTSIGSGKSNTQKLVKAMGTNAYTLFWGIETTADYAARLCSILEYEHDGVVYNDWFLPSKDELDLMYENFWNNGLCSFAGGPFWSSSEYSADDAWAQHFASDGAQIDGTRYLDYYVRPIRAF